VISCARASKKHTLLCTAIPWHRIDPTAGRPPDPSEFGMLVFLSWYDDVAVFADVSWHICIYYIYIYIYIIYIKDLERERELESYSHRHSCEVQLVTNAPCNYRLMSSCEACLVNLC